MRVHLLLATFTLTVAAASGCVSLGEHEELEQDAKATRKALADTRSKLADKEKDLLSSSQKNASLTLELAAVEEDHRTIETKQRALEQELAHAEAQSNRSSAELDKIREQLAQTLKDRSRLSSSVDEMRKALDELAKRRAEADARIAEYRGLLERFKTLIDAGKLKVKIVDGRMVVELATDILFGSGSANLSREGRLAIAEVARLLTSIPGRKLQVEGHTDNVPIKTPQYPSNWELAAARALNVLKEMVEAGMPAERVSAASFGDSKPAFANDTTEHKASNRRIEVVLVPDLSSLPGFEELSRTAK